MSGRFVMLVVLAAAYCSRGGASVPEGLGSVEFGMGYTPFQTLEISRAAVATPPLYPYYYNLRTDGGTQWNLQFDFPVWSGISLGLGGQFSKQTTVFDSGFVGWENGSLTNDERTYAFQGTLKAYPAAFMGLPFCPGKNANADGWIYWPSVTLQYRVSKTDELGTSVQSGNNSGSWEANTYLQEQFDDFGLVLPLQTWLSVKGSYYRSLQENSSTSNNPNFTDTSGQLEGENMGLTAYIDLIRDAGSDPSKSFLPHLGRLGQMAVGLEWERDLNLENYRQVTCTQTYSLILGAPLTSSLGVSLKAAQTEPDHPNNDFRQLPVWSLGTDNRDTWIYSIQLSWAFGRPEHRVDD